MTATYTENVVQGEYRQPVKGADVYLLNEDGSLAATTGANPTVTDTFGFFTFTAADGVYYRDVRVAGVSYARDSIIIGTPEQFTGNTGPANSTYATLALLKAAPVTNGSYTLLEPSRQEYSYVPGNFAALINDIDFVALNGTPATTGALVAKRSDRSTLARFGAVGDGVTDDTLAVQAALNWSGATQRPVFGIGIRGNSFAITTAIYKAFTQLIGDHFRGTSFIALPSSAPGLFQIDIGPVIETRWETFKLIGNYVNPGQHGIYAYARRTPTREDGGLWYSTFRAVGIESFGGHAAWFRGGNVDIAPDGSFTPGTYSFTLPHQFNTFYDCSWYKGNGTNAGGVLSNALCATGQCGQFSFFSCFLDGGQGSGTNIAMGRECVNGTRDQGTGFVAGAFVAPGFFQFRSLTSQGEKTAIYTDQCNNTLVQGYFENLKLAIIVDGGSMEVNNSYFPNAANNTDNGMLFTVTSARVTGRGNVAVGTIDRLWSLTGDCFFDVEIAATYGAAKTFGTVLQNAVDAGESKLNLGQHRYHQVNDSTTAVINIETRLLPGEVQHFWTSGTLILQSSGVIDVPGGRAILRYGDTAWVTRSDYANGTKLRVSVSIGPLMSASMPTTGYYEAGEYVRSTAMLGTGTVTIGWQRLTTGTSHVAGTDWRAITATGAA